MPLSGDPGAPVISAPERHNVVQTRTGKGTRVIIPTPALRDGLDARHRPQRRECRDHSGNPALFQQPVHIINPWGQEADTFRKLKFQPATFNPP
jgi:type IV secretion system protein VirD4